MNLSFLPTLLWLIWIDKGAQTKACNPICGKKVYTSLSLLGAQINKLW